MGYIQRETLIGTAIGAGGSLVLTLWVFGQKAWVPVHGGSGLLLDAGIQALVLGFMGSLVPTVLTRRRLASAELGLPIEREPPGVWTFCPRSLLPRAVAFALVAALLCVGLHILIFGILGIEALRLWVVVPYKMCLGAVLGAAATYGALLACAQFDRTRVR